MSREVVEREIEAARKRLLDLTMRNRLLNYRPSKAKTLKIVDELPTQVYKMLVQSNKVMDFKAKPKKADEPVQQELAEDDFGLSREESAKLWQPPTRGSSPEARHTDKYLQTTLDPESLQKRLFKIHSLANSFFEEQGYSVLFLALGFLQWRESKDSGFRSAPLVLVPVELTRQSVGAPYRLVWTGDEVLGNISLVEKLKEQIVDLPQFDMPDDDDTIDSYFKKVVRATKQCEGWQVNNDIAIDFFSFTKFILWRDLDKKSWPAGKGPADHKLLTLLLDNELTTETIEPFPEDEVDERLRPENIYHIVDADPSQIAVIEDVKAGVNLVVEGPPGTGKSQTITNTIAELLSNDKTVLFVSEKMAALEVVKARLDRAGLGDYCLELHSRNTKKKEFIQELRRCTESPPTQHTTDPHQFQKLELLRRQLNEYVAALRTPIGGLAKTPYQLYSMKERVVRHFVEVDRNMPVMQIKDPKNINSDSWDAAITKLKELALRLKLVEPVDQQPWRETDPGLLLPEDVREIGDTLSQCINTYDAISESLQSLIDLCGIVRPNFMDDILRTLDAAELVEHSVSNDRSVLLNAEWNASSPLALTLIERIKRFQDSRLFFGRKDWSWITSPEGIDNTYSLHANCLKKWNEINRLISQVSTRTGMNSPNTLRQIAATVSAAKLVLTAPKASTTVLRSDVWDDGNKTGHEAIQVVADCQSLRANIRSTIKEEVLSTDNLSVVHEFLHLQSKWYRHFLPRQYTLRKLIRGWFRQSDIGKQLPTAEIEKLLEYYKSRAKVAEHEAHAAYSFDVLWRGEFSDVAELKLFAGWILEYRAAIQAGILSNCSVEKCLDSSDRQTAQSNCDSLLEHSKQLNEQMLLLEQALGRQFDELCGSDIQDLEFSKLTRLLEMVDDWQHIKRSTHEGRNLFGRLWHLEESDCNELARFSNWVVDFRHELLQGLLSERACSLVDEGALRQDIQSEIDVARQQYNRFANALSILESKVGEGTLDRVADGQQLHITRLAEKLHTWRSSLDNIVEWSNFCLVRHSCSDPLTEPLVKLVLSAQVISSDDIIPLVEGNFADSMLRIAMGERPILAQFTGDAHESKVEEFASTDRSLIELNKARVQTLLSGKKPRLYEHSARNSQAGILIDQFNRQRKLLPIRQLMGASGNLIQRIKPCFMMSPLSIAQFLDPQTIKFDVIVFDEASQVKPEDALGALMRGNQLVVMGDTRQLPPTSFFDHVTEDEPDEEVSPESTSVIDVESILHQCKRRFPTRMLTWHYRSRHDSLIAVSNTYFYDNHLQVFPAPSSRGPGIGLHFVQSDDTSYDRGKSSVNHGEAVLVAKAAMQHYVNNPTKSLGIGTFNIKQQEAIKQQIEIACRTNPSVAEYFHTGRDEHFFVKNLETIQGDERDVILISVGYGFDTNGKFSKNFGPLNQDGGERRLNVLITRARESCVVFANFRSQDFSVEESDSRGVRALKAYVEYAEKGVMPQAAEFRADSDSPFEDSVYDYLISHGYNVQKQVGCARYWIDLAVVDPAAPGTYLIGIECDGALYHSSRVARERDRLRQQVLEGLGWNLHRIWSTDWYRNRSATQRKLREVIENSKLGIKTSSRYSNGKSSPSTLVHAESRNSQASDENEVGSVELNVGDSQTFSFEPYQICNNISLPHQCPLHEVAPKEIGTAVVEIVDIESPVHVDEVVQRVRTLCGYSRAGQRMQDAIQSGISHAVGSRKVRQQGQFLFTKDERATIPRRRIDNLDINWVCDAELTEFFRSILRTQFAMPKDDLVNQTARHLGFQRMSDEIDKKISLALKRAVRTGVIIAKQNGLVDLA